MNSVYIINSKYNMVQYYLIFYASINYYIGKVSNIS